MKEIKTLILGTLFSLIGFVSAHAGDDSYSHHDYMMGSWYGTGTWLFSWVFMILAIVALVLLIVWLIKQIKK
ncbi:MAG: hypothetical protein WDZ69_00735 [Candidatus Pacearchaeota archaeon]